MGTNHVWTLINLKKNHNMSKLVISIWCLFFTISMLSAQSPVGIWKNVDDEDEEEIKYSLLSYLNDL